MSIDCIFQSIAAHPTAWALSAAYVFTGAINALPEPGTNLPWQSLLYHWVYDFLHVLSNRVQKRYPQTDVVVPQKITHIESEKKVITEPVVIESVK